MKIDMINKKGERVRVNSQHAKVLAKIGVLKYPPVEVEVKAPPLSLPKKGAYARRDMVAEPRVVEASAPVIGTAIPAITTQSFLSRTSDRIKDDGKA